jgi:hypothetical protein
MSETDYYIIGSAAALILFLTTIRFLITELTAIVILLKQFIAAIKSDMPKENPAANSVRDQVSKSRDRSSIIEL